MKRVFRSLKGISKIAWEIAPMLFGGVLLLSLLQGVLPSATAWSLKQIFDLIGFALRSGTQSGIWNNLLIFLLLYISISVISPLIDVIISHLRAKTERKVKKKIQGNVLRKINSLSGIRYFEEPTFYDKVSLAVQGSQFGLTGIADNMISLFRSLSTMVSFMALLSVLNPWLAILLVTGVVPQIITRLFLGRLRVKLTYELSPLERMINYLQNLLSGQFAAKEIRSFISSDYLIDRFLNALEKLHKREATQQKHELLAEGGSIFISSLVTGGAFFVVIIQALQNSFTIGDVALYLGAIQSLTSALSNVAFTIANLTEGAIFFENYTDLMNLNQPVFISKVPREFKPLQKEVEIRNLAFHYPNTNIWVLKNIDLRITRGESLVLVGPNGAGKSTLVKLFTRLYDPSSGEICWDGHKIQDFDISEYRKRVGVIFQDFVHYEMNAAENIGLGNPERIDDIEAIRQAAGKAGIRETIEHLPNGYETPLTKALLGEFPGTEFSGGEWQKVALARLFMRDADLYILDEPTASLDAEAESEIYRTFIDLIQHKTCIVISHRLAISKYVDKIAVLDQGRIVEYGSHKDLVAAEGRYARLFSLQSQQYAH